MVVQDTYKPVHRDGWVSPCCQDVKENASRRWLGVGFRQHLPAGVARDVWAAPGLVEDRTWMDERSGKDGVGCCRRKRELVMVQSAMSEGLAAVALNHLAYEVVNLQM